MKKAVIIFAVMCMMTGAAFSSPVQLAWIFLKEAGKAIIMHIGIGIGEGLFDKQWKIGRERCEVMVSPNGDAVIGSMLVCVEVDEGMSECSVLEDCMPN